MNRAVFLDRDGVLNALVERPDGSLGAPLAQDGVRMLPGAAEAAERLSRAGWLTFIVSNQPDAFYERATFDDLYGVHVSVMSQLRSISDWAYCYHGRHDKCGCRKPSPGLLLSLARKWNVDLRRSWMVGDRDVDIAAGAAAGVGGTILVNLVTVHISPLPSYYAIDLAAAAAIILR